MLIHNQSDACISTHPWWWSSRWNSSPRRRSSRGTCTTYRHRRPVRRLSTAESRSSRPPDGTYRSRWSRRPRRARWLVEPARRGTKHWTRLARRREPRYRSEDWRRTEPRTGRRHASSRLLRRTRCIDERRTRRRPRPCSQPLLPRSLTLPKFRRCGFNDFDNEIFQHIESLEWVSIYNIY